MPAIAANLSFRSLGSPTTLPWWQANSGRSGNKQKSRVAGPANGERIVTAKSARLLLRTGLRARRAQFVADYAPPSECSTTCHRTESQYHPNPSSAINHRCVISAGNVGSRGGS